MAKKSNSTKKTIKKVENKNKVCPVCGKVHGKQKRENLNLACSPEELDNMKLIQNKLSCANQAARPNAIPDNVSADKIDLFVKAALNTKAEALFLQQMWWEEMKKKYNLPPEQNVFLDFMNGSFYILK